MDLLLALLFGLERPLVLLYTLSISRNLSDLAEWMLRTAVNRRRMARVFLGRRSRGKYFLFL